MGNVQKFLEYKEAVVAVIAIAMAALNLWSIGKLAPVVQNLATMEIRVTAIESQVGRHYETSEVRLEKIADDLGEIKVDIALLKGSLGVK